MIWVRLCVFSYILSSSIDIKYVKYEKKRNTTLWKRLKELKKRFVSGTGSVRFMPAISRWSLKWELMNFGCVQDRFLFRCILNHILYTILYNFVVSSVFTLNIPTRRRKPEWWRLHFAYLCSYRGIEAELPGADVGVGQNSDGHKLTVCDLFCSILRILPILFKLSESHCVGCLMPFAFTEEIICTLLKFVH